MLHTVHFLCPVNTATVSQLQNVCLSSINQGSTEINLHISSQGGETAAGFTAYNFLKSLPVTLRTHNISNIESIANVIFLAGSERFANPISRFVLHPLLWGFGSPSADHARLREYGKCLDNDLDRFVQIFNIEVGTGSEWSSLVADSTILDADKALEHGIINAKNTAKLASGGVNWWVV
ncbi:Clp protease [Pectobacterium parmentieri]|uniref:ATP-dependent Clp protease proteolytic subunit n=1 Tax=Pectobacterium parmentieri TaxID=1905730 RepID=UPI000D61EA92|nr:ATP-dependent Clp protease proteolytic subunit [Pectobacterium parmentieri]PWD58523.1 Clp protease [Pectobacterium parmentieri]QHQ14642.1 Clp protease [Pectobacterium parmentieri]